MIEVHLYGKLRRFAPVCDSRGESVVLLPHRVGDTVLTLVERLGIPLAQLGDNLFVSGRYASLATPIEDGDRVGLFPDDMSLLYKWYFSPKEGR